MCAENISPSQNSQQKNAVDSLHYFNLEVIMND